MRITKKDIEKILAKEFLDLLTARELLIVIRALRQELLSMSCMYSLGFILMRHANSIITDGELFSDDK